MPTTKNAQLRYQVLDRCFSDFSHYYFIEDLIEQVNEKLDDLCGTRVGMRQIRDDIKFLRDRVTYNAPITAYPYEGKRCFYRYSEPDFSIYKNELSIEDLSKLRATIEMLGRYRGLPANAWLEEVISNLEYRFGVKANTENLICFEQNDRLKGLEHLSGIIDATIHHQPLSIDYRTYRGDELAMTIHPYYVKQYNGRWFLLGLEQQLQRIANVALDRIKQLSPAKCDFIKNTTINFDAYFDDVVGVTVPESSVKKEQIVLKFDPSRFPYVVSKPMHHSQHILNSADCTITIDVKPTRELEQQICSFGSDVEVISPTWYRDLFRKKIEANLKKYSSVKNDHTEKD